MEWSQHWAYQFCIRLGCVYNVFPMLLLLMACLCMWIFMAFAFFDERRWVERQGLPERSRVPSHVDVRTHIFDSRKLLCLDLAIFPTSMPLRSKFNIEKGRQHKGKWGFCWVCCCRFSLKLLLTLSSKKIISEEIFLCCIYYSKSFRAPAYYFEMKEIQKTKKVQ